MTMTGHEKPVFGRNRFKTTNYGSLAVEMPSTILPAGTKALLGSTAMGQFYVKGSN